MAFTYPPMDDPSMKHFWSSSGYYRGHQKIRNEDVEVPTAPPTMAHVWDGISGWILDTVKFFDFLRIERDSLLKDSDKYVLEDFPITDEKRNEWKAYRQLLRDLPSTIDPNNPVWPEPPED